MLAKYLNVSDVAHYGLFVAAVFYALLLFGLDMHVYTTREIARNTRAVGGGILKSQAALLVIVYLGLAPPVWLMLPYTGIPLHLLLWFFPILMLEHLNQEIFRLLTVEQKQLAASFLLFLRQGSWALLLGYLFIFVEASRSLETVLALWCTAGTAAAVGGVWRVWLLRFGGWTAKIDWAWLKRGLLVCTTFLVATLALRAVQTFDRFFLEVLTSIEIVGAYVLFVGIATALSALLDASVFAFKYPKLIKLVGQEGSSEFWYEVRGMALQVILFSAIFVVTAVAIIQTVLAWIDKRAYIELAELFYWCLAASVLFSWSMIPHYVLYACDKDRHIAVSQIISMGTFFVVVYAFAYSSPLHAVPLGVAVAMAAMLICKVMSCLRVRCDRFSGVENGAN